MKKIYQQPSTEIVEVAIQQMLASSPGAGLDPTGSVDAGEVESRGFFFDGEF